MATLVERLQEDGATLALEAAAALESDAKVIAALREALTAAREFVSGMVKPAKYPTTLTISSYSPCHELIDKIDAAMGSNEQTAGKK